MVAEEPGQALAKDSVCSGRQQELVFSEEPQDGLGPGRAGESLSHLFTVTSYLLRKLQGS